MKTSLKSTILILACIICSALGCRADDKTAITVSQLPKAARTTLTKYFKNVKVNTANKERDDQSYKYHAYLKNGAKVKFDGNGKWTEVEAKGSQVPNAIVPSKILSYVKKNYKGQKIIQIERDSEGYEVELSNCTELHFNNKYQMVKADD